VEPLAAEPEIEPAGDGKNPLRNFADDVARIDSEHSRLLQRLGEGERRLQLISRSILRVQESERARISRELHDQVGQDLTALKLQIEILEQEAAKSARGLAPRLSELKQLADHTLHEVRHISRLLRPQMLDDLGLMPTLEWLARSFHRRTGIEVELAHEGMEDLLDPEMGTFVFRVVQEALTNVAKHARAASARVRLRRAKDSLFLRVEDQGVGFDPAPILEPENEERGFGVRGMRERVRLFGGHFALRSSPGSGTVIEVEVPLLLGRSGS